MRRFDVRVISRRKLREAWDRQSGWEPSLKAWYKIAKAAEWKHPPDLRQTFPSADSVGTCVIFNIGGNKCRLIAYINFESQRVYTLHVLSHADYDRGGWKDDCDCD
jgi:mRNA interferase HigB